MGASPPLSPQTAPWWTYPFIGGFGTKDPLCANSSSCYWKPDANIQIPGGYPVQALLSGTVTSVQNTSYGQTVVVVKLDTPLNSLATHTFYEHLSNATVSPGQHVGGGDLIGYNNPSGQTPLGFGLYSADSYGNGSGWTTLQNDLAPGGAGLLNPTSLLNNAHNSQPPTGNSGNYAVPPQWWTGIQTWLSTTLVSFGEHIAVFAIAMLLIILGVVLLRNDNVLGDDVIKVKQVK